MSTLTNSRRDIRNGDDDRRSLGAGPLTTLKEFGLGIEIDDFGTGYSSIGYLRQLPIDTVKVDQSLIRNLGTDTRQVAFVAAILRLIESAGLRTVVEGIERPSSWLDCKR